MRKNTQRVRAPRGVAHRAIRAGIAAASAIVVSAAGLAVAGPASAVEIIPVITYPAASSVVYDQYPVISGTAKPNHAGTVFLTAERGSRTPYCKVMSDAAGNWSCPKSATPLPFGSYTIEVKIHTKAQPTTFVLKDAAVAFPFALTSPGFGATVDTNRPVFAGTGRPGGSVIVFDGDVAVAGARIDANGRWSATATVDIANGPHPIRADLYTASLDAPSSSVHHFFTVNVAAPVAAVTLTAPASGSTVGTANPVFAGTGEAGASIVVRDGAGAELASTVVGTDGTWSVASLVALPNGEITATATQTVAGAAGTTAASTTFTVSVAAPVAADLVVTSPAFDEEVATRRPLFAGTGEPGASIQVFGSSGKVLASTTVGASGAWSVASDVELGNGHYVGTVTQRIPGGTTTFATLSYSVNVFVVKPFSVTSPAIGAVHGNGTPVYSGVGTPGATVEVRGNSGRVIASTTVDAVGNWTVPSGFPLEAGRYLGTVTHRHSSGNSTVGIDYHIAAAVTVKSPATGGSVSGPRPVYTGTGHPGATVRVTGSTGKVVATAVVGTDGSWTATADFDLGRGRYAGTAVHWYDGAILGSVAMEYSVS